MFDLNVWRRLNKEKNYFPLVRGITEGVIEPFMSDAYFIEVIERSSKKQTLSDFVNAVRRLKPGTMPLEVYPKFCEKFYSDLNWAINAGFKVISTRRIGFPHAPIEFHYLPKTEQEARSIESKLDEGYETLHRFKVGDSLFLDLINKIRQRHNMSVNYNAFSLLEYANIAEEKLIPDIIGELCDGDVVVGCYAHQIKYLCTSDEAKGFNKKTGMQSVFSEMNKKNLIEKLGMSIFSPSELINLLSFGD